MSKTYLIVFLLLAPILAYGTSHLVRKGYEGEYQKYLLQEYGDNAVEMRDRFPLAAVCAEQRRSGDEIPECLMYAAAGVTKTAAVATAAAGLLLFGLIGAAGYFSRFNRKVLLHVFRPGLYVTILAALTFVILHAGLTMVAIYLFSTRVVIPLLIFFSFLIGFAALIGCFAIVRGTFSIFRRPALRVFGKKLPPAEQPELYGIVRELAGKIGVAPPDHIVVGFELNFFVTEGTIECHDRRLWGRTLYLSLPYCRILAREEMLAILGHELGHFKGLDTQFTKKFSPIYRVATECLLRLQEKMAGARAVALFPAYYLLAYFFEAFELANNKLKRDRELAADRVGADLFGVASAGTGLIKIHAFEDFWDSFLYWVRDAVVANDTLRNGSARFAADAADRWHSVFYGLEERHTPHPMNSHPTLKVRLEELGLNASALVEKDAVRLPEKPAIELIAEYARIEEELTAVRWKSMVKAREAASQKTCPACRRVAALTADLCECGFSFVRLPIG
jgi:Zn-dependent protease with chaperone function